MELMAVVKAVKKVKMTNNRNDHKGVSIVGVAVSMILVAVSIVVHVKRVATLARVVMESLKAVARKMFVTEDKTAMVLDDTSVAISVVVGEEQELAAEAVEDVIIFLLRSKARHTFKNLILTLIRSFIKFCFFITFKENLKVEIPIISFINSLYNLQVHVTKMAKVDHRKMDRMEVASKGVQDVAIHVSVVQCVGSKMAMPMVLR